MNRILAMACVGALAFAIAGGAAARTSNFTVVTGGLDGPRAVSGLVRTGISTSPRRE